MLKINTRSADETKELGRKIGLLSKPSTLIIMTGDLGAGKTTLTQGIALGLNIKKNVTSPTFTIMKVYKGKFPLYHIDAYRLEGISQNLGLEEMMDDDGICVVEWPNFINDRLLKTYLNIDLKWLSENEREISITAIGSKYEDMIKEITC
ncbi:MAG: tRNA (adenosine(37)-N6)-threonylcarbamoyltransferase complex ATPase subunit type 1 TsaE [Erysipelotrichaceae bacterium]|nr:tRNA (adenosine(37)-N6)-threonylcarbamoyltransferase complex ATPase subunit type 1 TsaE [Erysipelotrichaceae bacterium]MDD4642030.1 tRNA (adenosine(37)-N6)-threonylcarbamoyltransferase complex ATPase subunit type 1 TsaE [Erysipelotrichaceae bacterium]